MNNSKIKQACDRYGISEELFENALNGIDPNGLSDDEIEQHAKWCSDNSDDIGA